jgi:hypothetical protein
MLRGMAMAVALALATIACSADLNVLGGRQKCWNDSDKRGASLMKGTLNLDPASPTLDTPEGDRLALYFSGVRLSGGTLVDSNGTTVARDGQLVTLFGGLGSDTSMVVCSVEKS